MIFGRRNSLNFHVSLFYLLFYLLFYAHVVVVVVCNLFHYKDREVLFFLIYALIKIVRPKGRRKRPCNTQTKMVLNVMDDVRFVKEKKGKKNHIVSHTCPKMKRTVNFNATLKRLN